MVATVATLKVSIKVSKCCDECKTNTFKYKSPCCSLRSCSHPCVKAYKKRVGCSGKRQQHTDFVPLSKFDDNLLLSDYSMLEGVKRIADSAKRMRQITQSPTPSCLYGRREAPFITSSTLQHRYLEPPSVTTILAGVHLDRHHDHIYHRFGCHTPHTPHPYHPLSSSLVEIKPLTPIKTTTTTRCSICNHRRISPALKPPSTILPVTPQNVILMPPNYIHR
ncbi:unnamed protein product [Lactuca virosa]|uniref:HIT-type domain-containing protein n=1 Tax=Lactuca virosa TaxID=75947 RepID=A0AAU9LZA5_9ASTR|nr:unnamed protein product [Lactuca virosa]